MRRVSALLCLVACVLTLAHRPNLRELSLKLNTLENTVQHEIDMQAARGAQTEGLERASLLGSKRLYPYSKANLNDEFVTDDKDLASIQNKANSFAASLKNAIGKVHQVLQTPKAKFVVSATLAVVSLACPAAASVVLVAGLTWAAYNMASRLYKDYKDEESPLETTKGKVKFGALVIKEALFAGISLASAGLIEVGALSAVVDAIGETKHMLGPKTFNVMFWRGVINNYLCPALSTDYAEKILNDEVKSGLETACNTIKQNTDAGIEVLSKALQAANLSLEDEEKLMEEAIQLCKQDNDKIKMDCSYTQSKPIDQFGDNPKEAAEFGDAVGDPKDFEIGETGDLIVYDDGTKSLIED